MKLTDEQKANIRASYDFGGITQAELAAAYGVQQYAISRALHAGEASGPPPMTPAQRVLRARLAAHALHAKRDPRETTAAATLASQVTRFERQVDPHNELDPAERRRRAESARKAHMTSLALASSRKRQVAS